jgi:hypothetical protein
MQQERLRPRAFQKGLGLKKLSRNIFLGCIGRRVIGCLAVSTTKLTVIGRRIYYMAATLVVSRPPDGWHGLS